MGCNLERAYMKKPFEWKGPVANNNPFGQKSMN